MCVRRARVRLGQRQLRAGARPPPRRGTRCRRLAIGTSRPAGATKRPAGDPGIPCRPGTTLSNSTEGSHHGHEPPPVALSTVNRAPAHHDSLPREPGLVVRPMTGTAAASATPRGWLPGPAASKPGGSEVLPGRAAQPGLPWRLIVLVIGLVLFATAVGVGDHSDRAEPGQRGSGARPRAHLDRSPVLAAGGWADHRADRRTGPGTLA